MHFRVRCRLRVPNRVAIEPRARIHVIVEEVTLADAPARSIVVRDFSLSAFANTLGPYEFDAELGPSRGEYVLRVHIDQTGDGRVKPGDLVSTARNAIPTGSDIVDLEVSVAQVSESP